MDKSTQNLLPSDGEIYYYPEAFSAVDSRELFRMIVDQADWKQEPVKIFGKEVMQPRLTAWYGDETKAYTYSGLTMRPHSWIPSLKTVKQVADFYSGSESTSALLNLYRDGKDSMGWHRDNERSLGTEPVIASVTFGQERLFQLRRYGEPGEVISLLLEPGSVLVMKGRSQECWQHRVPKSAKAAGARLNITFRKIM